MPCGVSVGLCVPEIRVAGGSGSELGFGAGLYPGATRDPSLQQAEL